MSKPAIAIISILVLLIIGFSIFYVMTRPDYGNDLTGMHNIISKHNSVGEVVVLDSVDISGNRYVGFSEGEGTVGLLVLIDDGRGNYVFENIYREQASIATFYEPFTTDMSGTYGADIIVSRNSMLKRVVRRVNNDVQMEHELDIPQPAVIVMEFFSEERALNVSIECYDISGHLIENVANNAAIAFGGLGDDLS